MADQTDTKPADADKAKADAQAAQAKAIEAQAKADEAKKSPEQREADKAAIEADKARSKAAEADAASGPSEPVTAIDAKVMSPHLRDQMGAGDHFAQKFGNDPANPKPARDEHADPDLCTVKLTRVTPDSVAPVATMVHPDMVGDYLRAGWERG